jgi:hypothetical protein
LAKCLVKHKDNLTVCTLRTSYTVCNRTRSRVLMIPRTAHVELQCKCHSRR